MRLLLLWSFLSLGTLYAQELTTQLSSQELLSGHYLTAEITLKNLDGELSPPDLSDFEIVGGPNESRQVQIVNGDMTQSKTYTYYLRPLREGTVYFPPVTVESEGEFYETEALEITVLPNPEGLPQPSARQRSASPFNDFFSTPNEVRPRPRVPNDRRKRKRKIYRI